MIVPELQNVNAPVKKSISQLVTVSPKYLYKQLLPAFYIINYSMVLPILESFLIEVDSKENHMRVVATDLETTVSVLVDCEAKEDFSFCIEARSLMNFLRDSDDAPTVIEYTKSANLIRIVQEDYRLKISGEETINYPKEPNMTEITHTWNCGHSLIIPQFKNALKFASNDDLRPSMTGVLFKDEGEHGLMVVATDAHKIYYTSVMDKTPKTMLGMDGIIPQRSLRLIAKFFKKEDVIGVSATSEHINFISGNKFISGSISVTCRMIDAKYPDYRQVLVDYETHFYLNRSKLKSFLKLAIHFANKSSNLTKVRVIGDKMETISGDVDFDMELTYKLPIYNCSNPNIDYTFGVNAKFLLTAAEVVSDEYMKISTSMTPTKGFVVDDCMLLMPLMINEAFQ